MSNCLVNQSNQNCAKIKELSKQLVSIQKEIKNISNDLTTNQFTFRPNYTGPPAIGLYTDWNLLYEDLQKMKGLRSIFFDDTDGSIIIPARTEPWDMENVSWTTPLCIDFGSGPIVVNFTVINISDGATLNRLCIVDGLIQINYQGTTVPAMIQDAITNPPNRSAESLYLTNGANIICSGSQSFIRVNTDEFACIMDLGSQLNPNSVSSFEIFESYSSGFFQILVGYISNVNNNSVRGTGTISIDKNDLTAGISNVQPNASSVNYSDNVSANSMQYVPSNLADWNGTAPSSLQNALDRIAAFIATNIGPIT